MIFKQQKLLQKPNLKFTDCRMKFSVDVIVLMVVALFYVVDQEFSEFMEILKGLLKDQLLKLGIDASDGAV